MIVRSTTAGRWRSHLADDKRMTDTFGGAIDKGGVVSADRAFHDVEHGHETRATYRHQFKASQPWHIDFCFVPASWVNRLVGVDVIDGEDWAARSDHLPLTVDLRLPRRR